VSRETSFAWKEEQEEEETTTRARTEEEVSGTSSFLVPFCGSPYGLESAEKVWGTG